jgi:hypothetical protein
LRPAYDRQFAEWLYAEMAAIPSRGRLTRRLVRDLAGRPLGWHVCLIKPRSTAEVLQVAARPGEFTAVLEDLFCYAEAEGASALYGRLDHQLLTPLTRLGFLRRGPTFFRRCSPALLHSRDPEILGAAELGAALLTRMDGEWWMALRTERYRGSAREHDGQGFSSTTRPPLQPANRRFEGVPAAIDDS